MPFWKANVDGIPSYLYFVNPFGVNIRSGVKRPPGNLTINSFAAVGKDFLQRCIYLDVYHINLLSKKLFVDVHQTLIRIPSRLFSFHFAALG